MTIIPTPLHKCLIADTVSSVIFFEEEKHTFPFIEVPLLGGLVAMLDVTAYAKLESHPGDNWTSPYVEITDMSVEIDDAIVYDEDGNEWKLDLDTDEMNRLII